MSATPALALAALCLTACAPARGLLLPPTEKPVSLTLPSLSGAPLDVASLHGQVVLVDFWATWCEPCRETLPKNAKLVREGASRGLAGLAISVDEDSTLVAPFVKQLALDLPVLLDPGGVAAMALGGEQLPYVVLLDRAGRKRFAQAGTGPALEKALAQAIEALLAESPSR